MQGKAGRALGNQRGRGAELGQAGLCVGVSAAGAAVSLRGCGRACGDKRNAQISVSDGAGEEVAAIKCSKKDLG